MQHASCKLNLARKPITTAIKLATTLQDLCKSCRVVADLFQAHLNICVPGSAVAGSSTATQVSTQAG